MRDCLRFFTPALATVAGLALWLATGQFAVTDTALAALLCLCGAVAVASAIALASQTFLLVAITLFALQAASLLLGMSVDVAWWYPSCIAATGVVVLGVLPLRFAHEGRERALWLSQALPLLALLTFSVPLSMYRPQPTERFLLWIVPAVLVLVSQDFARRSDARREAAPALPDVVALCVFAAVLIWRLVQKQVTSPAGPAVWLSGGTLVALIASALRRHAGFYIAALALLGAVQYELYVHDPIKHGGVSTPATTLAVVALALACAVLHDGVVSFAGRQWPRDRFRLAWGVSLLPYACALWLLTGFLEYRMTYPWALPALGAVALVGVLAGRASRLRTAPAMSTVYLVFVGSLFIGRLALTDPWTVDPTFPFTVFFLEVLVFERWVCRRGLTVPEFRELGREVDFEGSARAVIVSLSAALAVFVVYDAPRFGAEHQWTTLGWAGVGGWLMVLGFLFGEAIYRRVALGVLGLSLLRVFLFDTRHMSDAGKTVTLYSPGAVPSPGWVALFALFARNPQMALRRKTAWRAAAMLHCVTA